MNRCRIVFLFNLHTTSKHAPKLAEHEGVACKTITSRNKSHAELEYKLQARAWAQVMCGLAVLSQNFLPI